MEAGPDVWGSIDFDWMEHLAEYDFWDVDRNSAPPAPGSTFDPVPDVYDVVAWAKLRIAKAIHEHALPPALGEVEQLARLCFTGERFSTQLAGAWLLRLVRQAREREPPLPLRTVDIGTERRMLRAITAARAFAQLDTPAAYEGDFAHIALGRCAALHDGVETALLFRKHLRVSRREDYQRMERLLSASPECRLALLRQRWALPDEPPSAPTSWWEFLTNHVMRPWSAEVGLSLAELDGFSAYEERAP